MTRQEFVSELRIALQDQVSQQTLKENLDYYETYIMQESRKGRTEEEVLEELGNPRLIAKTIISSEPDNNRRSRQENYSSYNDDEYNPGFDFQINGKVYRGMKAKVLKWTAIIAIILVIFGIIALAAGVISILAPVIVPLLIILIAVRLISRR